MEVTRENFPNLTAKQRASKQALEYAAEERRASMRAIAERECEHCNAIFKPKKSWQKFCKPSCRMKNWNENNLPKPELVDEKKD